MRVDHHQPRVRGEAYSQSEDTMICRMNADGVSPDVIAAKIGRTGKAVQGRIYVLRREGAIPGYSPRRRVLEVSDRAVRMDPPIVLRDDDLLIRACTNEGGFPRAEVIDGRTYWLDWLDMGWRHRPPTQRRAA